ncbi:hypothetical protein COLO4_08230 [Corchorus olitorius]|uniref:Uncharacterized protein n=1 Tax=Corchorus olitorius TaxID=93759 RepID=A0A1R3KGQ9_9ROSI|nr:hypothetical protein COLO4_08230 [Corchorus olitorius]
MAREWERGKLVMERNQKDSRRECKGCESSLRGIESVW